MQVTLAGRRPGEVIGAVCVLGGAFTRARIRVSEDWRWSSVSPRFWVFGARGEAGALTHAVTEFEGDCVWAGGRPKCSTGSPFDERGLRRVKRSVKRESTRAWHSSITSSPFRELWALGCAPVIRPVWLACHASKQ